MFDDIIEIARAKYVAATEVPLTDAAPPLVPNAAGPETEPSADVRQASFLERWMAILAIAVGRR